MSNVTRGEFLEATVATAGIASAATIGAQQPRPNTLFIMADDLRLRRPELLRSTRLRDAGTRSDGARRNPLRQQLRRGAGLHADPLRRGSSLDVGLPAEQPTLSSLLRANRCDTALVGKWHLGWKPEFGPNRHGYTRVRVWVCWCPPELGVARDSIGFRLLA